MVKCGICLLIVASSLLLLLLFVSSSIANPVIDPRPHQLPSFRIKHEILKLKHQEEKAAEVGRKPHGGACYFTVKIKTSCYSPRFTSDRISLVFGDAYGNEVYAARLDDPKSAAFEQCSTDTYNIQGPCGYGICYLYLQRNGWDGWIPEWVKVYEPYSSYPLTFYYGSLLPNGVWYGFNNCRRFGKSSTGRISDA